MAEKLRSLLRSPRSVLPLKAAAFGLTLYWNYVNGGGWLRASILVLVTAALYFKPLFNAVTFLRSMAVLLTLAVLAGGYIPAAYDWAAALFFAALFYVIMGLKEFIFIARARVHLAVFTMLSYLTLFAYFTSDRRENFLEYTALAGLSFFFIMSELLGAETNLPVRHGLAVSGAFTMIFSQALWILGILPVGFLAATALGVIFAFTLGDAAAAYYTKNTNSRRLVGRAALFAVLAVLILLASKWTAR